jgi:hypothetical protein
VTPGDDRLRREKIAFLATLLVCASIAIGFALGRVTTASGSPSGDGGLDEPSAQAPAPAPVTCPAPPPPVKCPRPRPCTVVIEEAGDDAPKDLAEVESSPEAVAVEDEPLVVAEAPVEEALSPPELAATEEAAAPPCRPAEAPSSLKEQVARCRLAAKTAVPKNISPGLLRACAVGCGEAVERVQELSCHDQP